MSQLNIVKVTTQRGAMPEPSELYYSLRLGD